MRQGIATISFGDAVADDTGSVGRIRSLLIDRSRCRIRALVLRRGRTQTDAVLCAHSVVPDDRSAGQLQQHQAAEPPPWTLPRRYGLAEVTAAFEHGTAQADGIAAWPFGIADLGLLRAGQPVYGPYEQVGRLQQVIVRYPEWDLVALVVGTGRFRRRSVRIPQALIVGWAGDHMHVSLDQAAIRALPAYRPDHVIRSAVERALRQDDSIRRVDGGMIAVQVSDGCVTLTGHVTDGRQRRHAEMVARQIPGVRSVSNALIVDAELIHAASEAIARVTSRAIPSVSVTVTHGVVVVFGEVPNADTRQAMESAVADIPQIRMVINRLRSPDLPEGAPQQLVLQPRVGQRVFATDQYIGPIARVVMNPRLRQVTAIVVNAALDAPTSERRWLDEPAPARLLVLSAATIQSLSSTDVFLAITSRAIATADEFQPDRHPIPPVRWKPPFPYQREEVVFEAAVADAVRPPAIISRNRITTRQSQDVLSGRRQDTYLERASAITAG